MGLNRVRCPGTDVLVWVCDPPMLTCLVEKLWRWESYTKLAKAIELMSLHVGDHEQASRAPLTRTETFADGFIIEHG
jgi:hypothetical protein